MYEDPYLYEYKEARRRAEKRAETWAIFTKIIFCIFVLGFVNWLTGR